MLYYNPFLFICQVKIKNFILFSIKKALMEKSMQLSKSMIQQIIKEELANVLAEAQGPAMAIANKDWPTVARLAAQSAEEGFPKSDDMSRKELIARRFLRQLSLEIEDGGDEAVEKFAAYLERVPQIRDTLGAVWTDAVSGQ
jgi:hypothetical protein